MDRARALTRAEWQEDLAAADELGFVVHEIDAAQRAQWQTATAPVAERLVEEIGGRAPQVWAAILAARAQYRALQSEAE